MGYRHPAVDGAGCRWEAGLSGQSLPQQSAHPSTGKPENPVIDRDRPGDNRQ